MIFKISLPPLPLLIQDDKESHMTRCQAVVMKPSSNLCCSVVSLLGFHLNEIEAEAEAESEAEVEAIGDRCKSIGSNQFV
jgi:hypothetical protein